MSLEADAYTHGKVNQDKSQNEIEKEKSEGSYASVCFVRITKKEKKGGYASVLGCVRLPSHSGCHMPLFVMYFPAML